MAKLLLSVALCLALTSIALSQVPDSLSYQGCLTLGDGPVSDGLHEVLLTLYDHPTAGSAVWSEVQVVTTADCVFSTYLGRSTTLADVTFDSRLWLAISVDGGGTLIPRTPLASAPYALGVRGFAATPVSDSQHEALNVIAGSPANTIFSPAIGATIGGGGARKTLGGRGNVVSSDWGTVAGGADNRADGDGAVVSGGVNNLAKSIYSVAAGGQLNRAGYNYLDPNATSHGTYATISGGRSNLIDLGDYGTIPGGFANMVSGDYGFAAGRQAFAQHDGTFVWADHTGGLFASTAPGQFLLRASGGVGIGTDAPGSQLHVKQAAANPDGLILEYHANSDHWNTYVDEARDYNLAYNGVLRTWFTFDDGALHNISDRRLKRNIESLPDVLDRVLRLKPSSYAFENRSPGDDRRAIGFIAQDVAPLFPELVSEKDGVMGLAYAQFVVLAIKAIQEQQTEIEALREEVRALRSSLR